MSTERAYVTKRILVRTSKNAVRKASFRSMTLLGYSVEAHDGWVVKKFADGSVIKLSELPHVNRPKSLSSAKKQTPRLRVFAGPNGSGKKHHYTSRKVAWEVKRIPVDFGIYVNADDIAQALKSKGLSLKQFRVLFDESEFRQTAYASGLVNDSFTKGLFMHPTYTIKIDYSL